MPQQLSSDSVQRAFIVLGMHRSGTSALTGVLHALGVDLGSNLSDAQPYNPKGLWEHREIVAIDEQIMARMGRLYDDVRLMPEKWWEQDDVQVFRDRLGEILRHDFSPGRLWGMKDPRMCRLLPLWIDLLRELGIRPFFVILGRSPLEVARSLEKRDGFSHHKSVVLWLEHALEAIAATEGQDRVFVTYDQLLENWRATVSRIGVAAGLVWPNSPEAIAGEVDAFLDPGLRHHRQPARSRLENVLTLDPKLAQWAEVVHQAMVDAATGGAPLDQGIAAIHANLKREVVAFSPWVEDLFTETHAKRQALALKEEAFAVQAQTIAEMRQGFDEQARNIEEMRQTLVLREADLARQVSLNDALRLEIQARNEEISAIHQSRWHRLGQTLRSENAGIRKWAKVAYLVAAMVLPPRVKRFLRSLASRVRRPAGGAFVSARHGFAALPPVAGRPRVVHAIANFMLGGSSQLVMDLVQHLDHCHHEVMTSFLPSPPVYEGVTVREFPGQGNVDEMVAYLRDIAPDIVHVHYWGECDRPWYANVFLAAKACGCQIIENVNTPVEPFWDEQVARMVYVSRYVLETFGRSDDKSRVIYPGSNFELFFRDDLEELPDDCIGMVYRLEADKLNERAIDPFIKVVQQRPGTKVLIVGGGMLLEPYRRAVEAAGVEEAFFFTGYVPYWELPVLYRQMSVFVAPVWKESFGQVSSFAMNKGIPVVGYEVGALAEIIDANDLLAQPENSDQLAEIIISLLNDRPRRLAIGRHNHLRAQALFSVRAMVESYRGLYAELLEVRR